jgi:hypothetical protein
MGVGRNLTYKKEEFFNVNGFINHIQIRSGDDDLFINEAATKNTTIVTLRKASRILNRTKYKDWLIKEDMFNKLL